MSESADNKSISSATQGGSRLPEDQLEAYNLQRPLGKQPIFCYAPFKSLYFGLEGKVYACCSNQKHVLGNYPEQSIKEIWKGREADRLREHIKNNDLSLGCHVCLRDFERKNYNYINSSRYDELPLHEDYPTKIEFQISNTCNLECVMCSGELSSSIRKNRDGLPAIHSPYDGNFADQLEEFIPYLTETIFSGGEPFLIKTNFEIWDRMISINPKCNITVQTNGTILNDRIKDLLDKGNFSLCISMDSIEKEKYEQIRVNAKFDQVMENIDYFTNYCKKNDAFLGFSICPMRNNWREIPRYIEFCNERNAAFYFCTVWFPIENGLWSLSSEDLKEVRDYLAEFQFSTQTDLEKRNETSYKDLLFMVETWYQNALECEAEEAQLVPLRAKEALTKRISEFVESEPDLEGVGTTTRLNQYMEKVEQSLNGQANDMSYLKIIKLLNRIGIDPFMAELKALDSEKLSKEIAKVIEAF